MKSQTPTIVEYRGDPKKYVSIILNAIDHGRLFFNGVPNCVQTFRAISNVIRVVNSKNGKTLSVESLVTYGKKEHSGEFFEYSDKDFEQLE